MEGDGLAAHFSPPSFSGVILKRSAWVRSWNLRQASVHPASQNANGDRGPALLAWHGGTQPGSIIFSRLSELTVAGDRIIMRDANAELHFRSAPGGPSVDDWLAAITAAGGAQPLRRLASDMTGFSRYSRLSRITEISEEDLESELLATQALLRARDSTISDLQGRLTRLREGLGKGPSMSIAATTPMTLPGTPGRAGPAAWPGSAVSWVASLGIVDAAVASALIGDATGAGELATVARPPRTCDQPLRSHCPCARAPIAPAPADGLRRGRAQLCEMGESASRDGIRRLLFDAGLLDTLASDLLPRMQALAHPHHRRHDHHHHTCHTHHRTHHHPDHHHHHHTHHHTPPHPPAAAHAGARRVRGRHAAEPARDDDAEQPTVRLRAAEQRCAAMRSLSSPLSLDPAAQPGLPLAQAARARRPCRTAASPWSRAKHEMSGSMCLR